MSVSVSECRPLIHLTSLLELRLLLPVEEVGVGLELEEEHEQVGGEEDEGDAEAQLVLSRLVRLRVE